MVGLGFFVHMVGVGFLFICRTYIPQNSQDAKPELEQ